MDQRCDETRASGLTALELLTALAVAGILAGLALPALRSVVLNAQRLSAVNAFSSAIQFARSTAQTRDATIVLCQARSALDCGNEAGAKRWIVVESARPDDSATVPHARRVLRVLDTPFTGRIVSNRPAFEFRPFPHRSSNGTLSFCDPRGGRAERAIIVSFSGRPRLAQPSSRAGFAQCAPR